MQSLDGCPHILGNPMNTLAYPYATVTNFSSQSFPRRTISRNPSIISNPLDSYYVDNELELYSMSNDMVPRVLSNANFEALRTYQDETSFHMANGNEGQRQAETLSNNGNHCVPDNTVRNNERVSLNNADEVSRSVATGNELMNTRNLARSLSRISQESRSNVEGSQTRCAIGNENDRSRTQTEQEDRSSLRNVHFETVQADEANQNNESNPVGYYLRNRTAEEGSGRSPGLESESNYSDEETRNFGALADIRESRV